MHGVMIGSAKLDREQVAVSVACPLVCMISD
jgi:hypothetical protein